MKFTSKERKLTSNQKTMAIELGLADQKKAIELLYSQYRFPVKTCVQELVSNAFDAHKAANREHIPVKIQSPDELNDFYFSVRDYGNSMDDETIKNVYMRVNASTKSNDNKAIGGFGIGSKTPWAYTDTFILKTFLNGLETQYALVKGRSSVNVVYQGKTDQEDGTEVIFKTKPNDKEKFEYAIQLISLCAKVKPTVNLTRPLDFTKKEILSNTVNLVQSNLLDDKGVFVNMGGVLYNVDNSFFETGRSWSYSRRYNAIKFIIDLLGKNTSLVINLPIGALLPLQTREGLFTGGEEGQQNKAVLKKVMKYCLEVIESTLKTREKEVNSLEKAVDYFSGGMLVSRSSFKFDGAIVNSQGIDLDRNATAYCISRKASRGWNNTLKKGRKSNEGFIYFSDINKGQVYFSNESSHKSRLVNRLHRESAMRDIIVLEKDSFKKVPLLYDKLVKITQASDVMDVELEKVTSTNKGKMVDQTKVVVYSAIGERRFEYYTDKERNYWQDSNKNIVVVDKNKSAMFTGLYKYLGYAVWYVAKNNIKKLLALPNFYEDGEHILDLEKLRDGYISHRVARELYNRRELHRGNIGYVVGLANPNKASLLEEHSGGFNLGLSSKAYNLVMAKYGNAIERLVKKAIKRRMRVVNLVDKAPLAQHISNPTSLKGQARHDLDAYIIKSIGEWYGTFNRV